MYKMDGYGEITKSIIQSVDCPYQVFTRENTAQEVNDAYLAALERGKREGFVPLLVVSDDTLAEWLEYGKKDGYTKESILQKKCRTGKDILDERFEEYIEEYIDDSSGAVEAGTDDLLLSELIGEETEGEELAVLSSFLSFEYEGIKEVILFEVPTEAPWEVIAWVPMGGWNECPEAAEMMEVAKYWYEKYGAVPAAVSHDTLEFYAGKPLNDLEEAMELAREHYAFCPDRVDQGTATGTIAEVADCLNRSKVWYFWWD